MILVEPLLSVFCCSRSGSPTAARHGTPNPTGSTGRASLVKTAGIDSLPQPALAVMVSTTPLYLLCWRLSPCGKGRKHVALFIPNNEIISPAQTAPPDEDIATHKGLLLQVIGSPFTGYMHSFVHNFSLDSDKGIEQISNIGKASIADGDKNAAQVLKGHASRVQAAGVANCKSSPPSALACGRGD